MRKKITKSLRQNYIATVSWHKARRYTGVVGAAALVTLALPLRANALNIYDGSQVGNNLEINLTTTVSYTGLYRVNDPSAILAGPTNLNGNDGDSNFQHGIVGDLFEAVPVLDIRDGDYGAHFSGQAFINTSYLGTNQNSQPGSLNSIYVEKNDDFTSATRNVNGLDAQVLDAFVYGRHEFADGQSLQLKVGRQTLFWGQSLFFASDGISGGQAPINIITAQDTINPQAQQVFMPVGQVVLTYQPIVGLTIQGYYQFEWEHDLFQGAGAYFNPADNLDKGGQSVVFAAGANAPSYVLLRTKDIDPEHQNGQFGLSVQDEVGNWDLGLFGLRFDSKAPEGVVYLGQGGTRVIPSGYAAGALVGGNYQLVYPRDIWLQGASFSTNVGDANVAGEVSAREHMPLLAPNQASFGNSADPGNATNDPAYPVGNVMYAQVSAIYLSAGVPLDPGGISFAGEVAMNHLIDVTANRAGLVPGHQATAAAFNSSITPLYNDVLPNLDLSFPIGLGYNFLGRSEVDGGMYHGTGTFSVGVTGTYRTTWIGSLAYQDYIGKVDPVWNGLADRGFVSLNLQHTF